MKRFLCVTLLVALFFNGQNLFAVEAQGYFAIEYRSFRHVPSDRQQQSSGFSLAFKPELYYAWGDETNSVVFSPFVRHDQYDEERNHADIRSLMWQKVATDWELRVGVHKVFWGVTESQHLVDVINQTDLVEEPKGEAKLGQPMVNLSLPSQWGTVDLFVLPYFRERTFPGVEGRLRSNPPVDTNQATYESSDKQWHSDYALRWTYSVDVWDLGLSYFRGTQREPALQLATNDETKVVLVPYYLQMEQWGLDMQATLDAWLLKMEGIRRSNRIDSYTALTVGFEYSFYGILDSQHDAGFILEYLYDERGKEATSPFDDDMMIGLRWVANDVQGSEALIGIIVDSETQEKLYSIEISRRLTDHWKLSITGQAFANIKSDSLFYSQRQDDYWQMEVSYYF